MRDWAAILVEEAPTDEDDEWEGQPWSGKGRHRWGPHDEGEAEQAQKRRFLAVCQRGGRDRDASVWAVERFRKELFNMRIEGTTGLIVACEQDNHGVVDALLARGARPDFATLDGWSPLMACSEHGSAASAKLLLACASRKGRHKMVSSVFLPQRWTPLIVAAHHARPRIVRLLLDHGARPSLEETASGWTALMSAAYSDSVECIELLLAHPPGRVDVHQTKQDGGDALMSAATRGNVAASQALLRRGADASRCMLGNVSALMLAAEHGHLECCRALCVSGADVLAKDVDGASATSLAVAEGAVALSAYLTDAAARSPLQRAVEARDRSALHAILRTDVALSHASCEAARAVAASVHPQYGLPTCAAVEDDLRNALRRPWTPATSHLFPVSFQARMRLLALRFCGNRGVLLLMASFLHRKD